jgi:cold shock CspA family protein
MNKPERVTGKVKFGFAVLDDGRAIFFHASQIVEQDDEPLASGERVSGIEDRGTRGPILRQVTRV